MTMYVFRCNDCGPFDAAFPIGTAPSAAACPACAAASAKVITAPRVGRGATGYSRAVEQTMASAHRPQVVSGSLPGSVRRPVPITRNPLHAKLPRP
ncbi:MAG: FmdB family zinc ribbon protein [Nakamurella sp.]